MKLLSRAVLLIFTVGYFSAHAQNVTIEKVLEKFIFKEANNPSATLYLHCDKTLYTNNETIWFAAYLQANRGTPIEKHHTLSVFLFNKDNKMTSLSALYLMEAGLASGSMVLPDSIGAGNFQLIAYTNVVDKQGLPFEIFSIPITIKSTLETKFNASIQLLDTAVGFQGARRISVKTSGVPVQKNGKDLKGFIKYHTSLNPEARTIQTNEGGEAVFKIDQHAIDQSTNTIYASVSFGNEIKYLSLNLPSLEQKKIDIKFYPEGGNLTDGISTSIGFEAKSVYGEPLSIFGIVLKDGIPIDTVETSFSGMGRFKIIPSYGSIYKLKAFKSNLLSQDTLYDLPRIVKELPIISVERATVGDTLEFVLKSAKPSSFNILIHNTHELGASFRIEANKSGRHVKTALNEVPKGINAITVLDDMNQPVAERLFFAHYTESDLLTSVTDKSAYKTREKVTVKLRLKQTDSSIEEKAIVSVAAVQSNRIQTAMFRDMESYTYLEHQLGDLAIEPNGMPYRNRKYLEDLLLVKGWRRFVFDEKQWPEKIDTTGVINVLELSGNVTKNGKNLNEATSITIIRDTLVNLIFTDINGNLNIGHENLTVATNKKIHFSVNKPNKDPYKFNFNNPYDNLNVNLPKIISMTTPVYGKTEFSTEDFLYKGSDQQIQLKTIVIKGNKDGNLSGLYGLAGNKCGDYVCSNNVLNCPNHVPNPASKGLTRVPVKGKTYTVITLRGGYASVSSITYRGCALEESKNLFHSVNGIQIAKEFYINDYKIDPIEGVNYQSTIYWTPFLQLTSSRDTEVSFYTSDLKAPYRIIVQGVSEKQVVTGATVFKVE